MKGLPDGDGDDFSIPICLVKLPSEVHSGLLTAKPNRTASRTSLAFQWLRLHAPNAGGPDSIPGRGTKIPQAAQCSQKKKKKKSLQQDSLFAFQPLCWLSVSAKLTLTLLGFKVGALLGTHSHVAARPMSIS